MDKGPICPHCGSPDSIPIVIGYPTQEAEKLAEEGKVYLWGCLCYGDERDHKWYCKNCDTCYGGKGQEPITPSPDS